MAQLERATAGGAIDPEAVELADLLVDVVKRLDVADAGEAKRLAGALRAGQLGVVEAVQAVSDVLLAALVNQVVEQQPESAGCRTTT